jgi:hypothetical protein
LGSDSNAHLQNFGLYDGVPGTRYNKAVKAVAKIEGMMQPVLREELVDKENLMKSDSVLGRLMKALREEGAEIMQSDDLDELAAHFSGEVFGITFAGRSCMPAVPLLPVILHCSSKVCRYVDGDYSKVGCALWVGCKSHVIGCAAFNACTIMCSVHHA